MDGCPGQNPAYRSATGKPCFAGLSHSGSRTGHHRGITRTGSIGPCRTLGTWENGMVVRKASRQLWCVVSRLLTKFGGGDMTGCRWVRGRFDGAKKRLRGDGCPIRTRVRSWASAGSFSIAWSASACAARACTTPGTPKEPRWGTRLKGGRRATRDGSGATTCRHVPRSRRLGRGGRRIPRSEPDPTSLARDDSNSVAGRRPASAAQAQPTSYIVILRTIFPGDQGCRLGAAGRPNSPTIDLSRQRPGWERPADQGPVRASGEVEGLGVAVHTDCLPVDHGGGVGCEE